MTDKTKPHTTVAQDVAAFRSVLDGQHATTEPPAEVLAPCPFCGYHAHYDSNSDWVSCDGCGATGPTGDDQISAIDAWNSRSLAAVKVDSKPWRWVVGDTVFESEAEAIEEVMQWGPSGSIVTPVYRHPAPPADPAKASEPEYDRDMIADMLEDLASGRRGYLPGSIAEQIRLLRSADNTDAAKVRTVRASGSAPDVETVARKLYESEQRSRSGEWTWDDCSSIEREGWTEIAQAAIEILQPATPPASAPAQRTGSRGEGE